MSCCYQTDTSISFPVHHGFHGIDPVQAAQVGVSATGTIVSGAVSAGVLSIGIPAAMAVPIIGVAVLGVSLALNAIFNRPTQKYKEITTDIVNQLEPQLRANVAAYMAGPRTLESQQQALENFDKAWAWLISKDACGNPQLDFPGKNCIADRQAGGKWDWFSYYRTPIASDPEPASKAAAAQQAAASNPLVALNQLIDPSASPDDAHTAKLLLLFAGVALVALL